MLEALILIGTFLAVLTVLMLVIGMNVTVCAYHDEERVDLKWTFRWPPQ